MNYPTIHVEKFAKIRKADIEVAPLTLFVGDNNSGKTYLSSLIWGIGDFLHIKGLEILQEKSEFHSILDWIKTTIEHPREESDGYKISVEEHRAIIDVINMCLFEQKNENISKILGSDIAIERLSMSLPFDMQNETMFYIRRFTKNGNSDNGHERHVIGIRQKDRQHTRPLIQQVLYRSEPMFVLHVLIRIYYRSFWNDAVYFPASRAGFLLTYRSLLEESLETRFPSRRISFKQEYQLTQPQVEFVKQLLWISNSFENRLHRSSGRFKEIICFIEKNIIKGQVLLTDTSVPEILYQPDGTDEKLPMQLVSGVVSEIASILACLKFGNAIRNLIVEEPELSLHPELQQQMARVLIRLSKQCNVLATTHSTIIAQHINNMVRYHNRTDGHELAKEYGHTEDDFIAPDKIRMYQFDVCSKDGMTDVTELKPLNNGFPVRTFADTLREMREEAWNNRIERKEERNHDA